jgi:hypothetical protein
MGVNKIITAVNALVNNVDIPIEKKDNVICIDTYNNRIGIKNASPTVELDICGSIQCTEYLRIGGGLSKIQLSQDNNNTNLIINKSVNILDNNNNIPTLTVNTIDSSNINVNDLSCNKINVLNANYIEISSNVYIKGDISLNNNLIVGGYMDLIGDLSLNGKFRFNDASANNLSISGNFLTAGNFQSGNIITNNHTITSDDRLKHNEIDICNGLYIIRKLNPQVYQKTKNFKHADYIGPVTEPFIVEAGLIAQDIFNIDDISYCVNVGNSDKPYNLNYNNIFVYGLAAIKELDKSTDIHINNMNIRQDYLASQMHDISHNLNLIINTDFNNINLLNIENLIKNQNNLIHILNSKIDILENKIINLENKTK